jgi:hypothetical protein
MKLHQNHPSFTAYCRDLERELFILDHGKEYGDNIIIQTADDGVVTSVNTLGALKIMAFNELMKADPVSTLREALDAILRDPRNMEALDNGLKALRDTRRFGKDWRETMNLR